MVVGIYSFRLLLKIWQKSGLKTVVAKGTSLDVSPLTGDSSAGGKEPPLPFFVKDLSL